MTTDLYSAAEGASSVRACSFSPISLVRAATAFVRRAYAAGAAGDEVVSYNTQSLPEISIISCTERWVSCRRKSFTSLDSARRRWLSTTSDSSQTGASFLLKRASLTGVRR